jgi:hypothetical protein
VRLLSDNAGVPSSTPDLDEMKHCACRLSGVPKARSGGANRGNTPAEQFVEIV